MTRPTQRRNRPNRRAISEPLLEVDEIWGLDESSGWVLDRIAAFDGWEAEGEKHLAAGEVLIVGFSSLLWSPLWHADPIHQLAREGEMGVSRPGAGRLVELAGFEPAAFSLRKMRSKRSDQGVCTHFRVLVARLWHKRRETTGDTVSMYTPRGVRGMIETVRGHFSEGAGLSVARLMTQLEIDHVDGLVGQGMSSMQVPEARGSMSR